MTLPEQILARRRPQIFELGPADHVPDPPEQEKGRVPDIVKRLVRIMRRIAPQKDVL